MRRQTNNFIEEKNWREKNGGGKERKRKQR